MGVENGGIVYALYDYTAEREDELSFSVGDAIQILRKTENWWWARASDQSEGFVPKTFIGVSFSFSFHSIFFFSIILGKYVTDIFCLNFSFFYSFIHGLKLLPENS